MAASITLQRRVSGRWFQRRRHPSRDPFFFPLLPHISWGPLLWGAPPPGLRWRLNDFADANLYGIYNKCAHDHTTLGFPRAHVWDLAVGPGSRDNFPICAPGPVAGAVGVRVRPPRAGASVPRGSPAGSSAGVCAVATGGSRARARAGASHTSSRGRLPYKSLQAVQPAEARAGASSTAVLQRGMR